MVQRGTSSINYDWKNIDLDEQAIRQAKLNQNKAKRYGIDLLENRKPMQKSLDDTSRLRHNGHLNFKADNAQIHKEIYAKGMPDCTDFEEQKELMMRGYGILENLNVAELNMIHEYKQKMQEDIFSLEV